MRSEEEIKARIERYKRLHQQAIDGFTQTNLQSDRLNVEYYFAKIVALEWALGL